MFGQYNHILGLMFEWSYVEPKFKLQSLWVPPQLRIFYDPMKNITLLSQNLDTSFNSNVGIVSDDA